MRSPVSLRVVRHVGGTNSSQGSTRLQAIVISLILLLQVINVNYLLVVELMMLIVWQDYKLLINHKFIKCWYSAVTRVILRKSFIHHVSNVILTKA